MELGLGADRNKGDNTNRAGQNSLYDSKGR